MESTLVLPGDSIPPSLLLPSKKSAPLKLSPGLLSSRTSPSGIAPTISGTVSTVPKKSAITLTPIPTGGRYVPHPSDLIIAQVHHSGSEVYSCQITPHTPYAILPQLAFEGATRKTRPQLAAQAIVYARVTRVAGGEVELSCVNAATGKSDGMGPLNGGCVFEVSLGLARRLMMAKPGDQGGVVVLEELGQRLQREGLGGFEIAIGRNGRVWVDAEGGDVKTVLCVGRCLMETDEGHLGIKEQRTLVDRMMKARGR